MKTKILLLLFLCGTLTFLSAQNDYPTISGTSPTIDGGSINFVRPATSGGWARGLFFHDQSVSATERWAGIGLLGTGGATDYIFLGHGDSPWSTGPGVYIAPDGKTGIGERFPSERFEVNGTSLFRNTNFFGTDTNNRIGIVSYNNTQDKFLIRGTAGHRLSLGANNQNDQMVIGLTGNVGIGTDNPLRRFDLLGPYGAQFRISDTDADATYKHAFLSTRHYSNAEQDFIWSVASSQGAVNVLSLGGGTSTGNAATSIDFFTAANNITTGGTKRMTIDKNGKVGIGIDSPDALLDLRGWTQSDLRLSTKNAAYYLTLEANENSANRFDLKSAGQDILGSKLINGVTPTYVNGYYGLALSAGTFNVSDNTVGLFVAPNGRVGIGTFSPSTSGKLHVKGGARVDSYLTLGANGSSGHTASGIILESHNDYRGTGTFSNGQTAEWFWGNPYTDHDGTFIIARGPQGTGTALAQKANALFTMTDAGNVSIGTTNVYADYKLSVAGKGRFTEVKVQPEIEWMDIVFEEGYNLRSLAEVKKYIEENGHLPDIPSAEDVVENGFDLGQMDANLLRKIEELTLYLIEKEEKIDQISKTNEDLLIRLERIERRMDN